MRGLKLYRKNHGIGLTQVASFTDAWIETKECAEALYRKTKSHLLQMRGLKRAIMETETTGSASHLLQMRGLKPANSGAPAYITKSHLLQMRGLKLKAQISETWSRSRIFYRCVD